MPRSLRRKDINQFADEWEAKFLDSTKSEAEINREFGKACDAVGFRMDGLKSFSEKYPRAATDYKEFRKIVREIKNADFLGCAIYSRWRACTHWWHENLHAYPQMIWFGTAFERLKELSCINEHYDADDDDGRGVRESPTKEEAGPGNTSTPYGLCKKFGIDLSDNGTPKDAWEALEKGTGITPEDAYNELKGKGTGVSLELKKAKGAKSLMKNRERKKICGKFDEPHK